MKRHTWNLTLTDGTASPVSLEIDPDGSWEIAVEKIIDLGEELARRRNKEHAARQMLDIAIHAAMHVAWLRAKHPKTLAKIVRDVDAVPVLVSPRRGWFEKPNEMPEAMKETIRLPIGENLRFKTKKIKQDFLYGLIRNHLYPEFEQMRAGKKGVGIVREIQELPALSKATAREWANAMAKFMKLRKSFRFHLSDKDSLFYLFASGDRPKKNLAARRKRMVDRAKRNEERSDSDPSLAATRRQVVEGKAKNMPITEGDRYAALKESLLVKLRSILRR